MNITPYIKKRVIEAGAKYRKELESLGFEIEPHYQCPFYLKTRGECGVVVAHFVDNDMNPYWLDIHQSEGF